MKSQMPIWGVGPKIMVPTFGYLVVAGIAAYLWPSMFLIRAVPYVCFLVPGLVLLAIGLPMLVVAVVSVHAAYKKDELATTGIFGIVRNPIYAAWIVFNIPGLVLLLRSWPMFFRRSWPTACSRCWWRKKRFTFKNATAKPTPNTRNGCQSFSRGRDARRKRKLRCRT